MAPGPIGFAEIEAFNRVTLAGLSVWDVRLIRRIDTAVLAVLAGGAAKPTEFAVTDTAGIKSLFRGLASQRRSRKPSTGETAESEETP